MMEVVFLVGAFILALAFGRNSVGNVFGSAIGTGIVSLKSSALLMGIFVTLGAFIGADNVRESVSQYVYFSDPVHVVYFSLILSALIFILTYLGLPLSVAQMGMGALAGWNLASGGKVRLNEILNLLECWIFSPVFSGLIAFFVFKMVRRFLKTHHVPLLHKELWVRFHIIWIGCLMAYMVGTNNLSVIIQPFTATLTLPFLFIKTSICFFVFIGCLLVSRRVVKTVSAGLFPLTTVEAMMMSFSAAITLFVFSHGFAFIPAIPVSTGASLIGAIVGISLAKGGYGLKVRPLIWVASSWMWTPLLSGLTCYVFVIMMQKGGIL